jgi:hypothetical protein
VWKWLKHKALSTAKVKNIFSPGIETFIIVGYIYLQQGVVFLI